MADWNGTAFHERPNDGKFRRLGAKADQLTIHRIAGGGIAVQIPANPQPRAGQRLTLLIQCDDSTLNTLAEAVYQTGTLNYSGGTLGDMFLEEIGEPEALPTGDLVQASATWLKVT